MFFCGLTYVNAQTQTQLKSTEKLAHTFKTIVRGLTDFDSYYEHFMNGPFNVYGGSRYINNFCNTQDRFSVLDQKNDLYNLLIKNAFSYSKEKIAILDEQIRLLGFELVYLDNLDVYQNIPYGDKIEKNQYVLDANSNHINEFNTTGLDNMFKVLTPYFEKGYGVKVTQADAKRNLIALIQSFNDKYSARFNYYDFKKPVVQPGQYHKDECLGPIAAINNKISNLGIKGEESLKFSDFGKEATKLMKTIKLAWAATKETFSGQTWANKLKKTYGFEDNKEYDWKEALLKIAKKTFPTVEEQLTQIKNITQEAFSQNKNLGNKTQAKVIEIFENANTAQQLNQFLQVANTYQDYAFIQSTILEFSKQQAEKQFQSILENQSAEIADVSALQYAATLDKTKQILKETKKIIGQQDESSLLYNIEQVHEKQCQES